MYGAVVRGDLALIQIGAMAVIGENSTLVAGRIDTTFSPSDAVATGLPLEPELYVGDYSLVGANCTMDSCYLDGDNVVGDGAVLQAGVSVGRHSIIEANSVVEADVQIPDCEVWGGSPAQKIRDVTADEQAANRVAAEQRCAVTQAHMYEFLPVGTVYLEKEKIEKDRAASKSVEGKATTAIQ